MKWLDDITHSVDVNLGKLRETVKDRCQGTFNFKGSNMFSSLCAISQGLSVPYQFLESRIKKSYMQFSVLRS